MLLAMSSSVRRSFRLRNRASLGMASLPQSPAESEGCEGSPGQRGVLSVSGALDGGIDGAVLADGSFGAPNPA